MILNYSSVLLYVCSRLPYFLLCGTVYFMLSNQPLRCGRKLRPGVITLCLYSDWKSVRPRYLPSKFIATVRCNLFSGVLTYFQCRLMCITESSALWPPPILDFWEQFDTNFVGEKSNLHLWGSWCIELEWGRRSFSITTLTAGLRKLFLNIRLCQRRRLEVDSAAMLFISAADSAVRLYRVKQHEVLISITFSVFFVV